MKSLVVKLRSTLLLMLCVALSGKMGAQTEGVSIKTTVSPPDASAMLDVFSGTKGLLIPRVQLQSLTNSTSPILNPANSLLVFNTNTAILGGTGYYYWDAIAATWQKMASGSGASLWSLIGSTSHIQYGAGNVRVGSGSGSPTYNLEVDKPNDFTTARFKGFGGEVRFGTFDAAAGGGPASYLTQTSTLDGANNWFTIRYAQVHGSGRPGISLNTWIYPSSTPSSSPGFCTIEANNNLLYMSSSQHIVFAPNGHSYSNYPLATFDPVTCLLTTFSDSTAKTNISNLQEGLFKIMQLHPVTYNWKSNPAGRTMFGLIAQEVETILPGLVTELTVPTDPSNPGDPGAGTGPTTVTKKTLSYVELVPILIQAIKEQQATITNLQNRVTALEN